MKYFKVYTAVIRISVHNILQYRVNLLFTWFIRLLALVVPFTFWSTIYSSQSLVIGYNRMEMITYIILSSMLSKLLLYDGIQQTISQDIRNGKLAQYLIRPMDYKKYIFFNSIIKKVVDFIVLGALLCIFMVPLMKTEFISLSISVRNLLLFLGSSVLAIIISYNIYFILGIISFWMVECSALYITLGTAFNFLAGGLFPLDMFCELKTISHFLPFQYQLFFPIKIYLGYLPQRELQESMLIQIIWAAALMILEKRLWNKGIKRFSSIGG